MTAQTWGDGHGQNNAEKNLVAYRPNPPSAGVMGVYAQHSKYFNSINHDICPREAFLMDLKNDILKLQEAGNHLIVMLDGNEDMRCGQLANIFSSIHLREVILQKHGLNAPSTYRRNTTDTPIDGIWASAGIDITAGGYFEMDEVITGTDHRCLWVDISYEVAFGYSGTPRITRPSARRLNTRNPIIRDNFNQRQRKLAEQHALLERIILLEESIEGELTLEQIQEFETIDKIRRNHIHSAEKKCRKLRTGNVPYSDTLQQERNKIEAYCLLLKFKKGLKVSSRRLTGSLKKAGIPTTVKRDPILVVQDELKAAYKRYYSLKKNSNELRETHLERLASAVASKGNLNRENIIKQLRAREAQRSSARKIKFLRGRLNKSSTTMVTVTQPDGTTMDITDKKEMERAIIRSNKMKFQLSFGTPFYNHPYNKLFGYLGITNASRQVLAGTFNPPCGASSHMKDFLKHLAMPYVIKSNPNSMELSVNSFISYWKKARENTSCYPSEFSFATFKVSSHDIYLATMDCILTRIPLNTGYSPRRWQRTVDVMIPKKSNLTDIDN